MHACFLLRGDGVGRIKLGRRAALNIERAQALFGHAAAESPLTILSSGELTP